MSIIRNEKVIDPAFILITMVHAFLGVKVACKGGRLNQTLNLQLTSLVNIHNARAAVS